MGIALARQPSPYVPPSGQAGTPTLIGGGPNTNEIPATTVEPRFSRVPLSGASIDSGAHHGYIVVTDNRTGEQWMHEAFPVGGRLRSSDSVLTASTTAGSVRPNGPIAPAASFSSDEPAAAVRAKLDAFGTEFNQRNTYYQLPPTLQPFLVPYSVPTRNSNYYAGAAREHLTGDLPSLPPDLKAPGWGDHRGDLEGFR